MIRMWKFEPVKLIKPEVSPEMAEFPVDSMTDHLIFPRVGLTKGAEKIYIEKRDGYQAHLLQD